ncbi:TetR/AcrR family transcriptional regulator [Streptomyces sp. HNM0575]|uniref:TetR/AcrR family transcriptional regulator n=1 Tax=Streptomyces sp. HNM0575 TaxID=2716338 RepID=UPI00145D0A19|nr:TetR/AcrR family transcriptional regulator [Streptomyces sp. HNM0575]NLU74843.1 TetR/AcrR family transcriptional regulator [Streptomyces sp. HNM0575]
MASGRGATGARSGRNAGGARGAGARGARGARVEADAADATGAADASDAAPEGRRERKKRETRQRISDVATGLMLDRGFDAVTVAEIAESADVSVNTVYNYFPSKEDIFFDREGEMTERPSRIVRERGPGQSAAGALLARLREDIADRSLHGGVVEGYDRFARCIHEASTLMARMMVMHQRTADRLAATLREETGAAPGDPRPELVAGQLLQFTNALFRDTTIAVSRGTDRDEVVKDALHRVDVFESLVADELLNYARRPGE